MIASRRQALRAAALGGAAVGGGALLGGWAAPEAGLGKPSQAPSGEYVVELEQRVAELESAQQRMYELEERVDFAERLLSQQRSPDRIPEVK